MSTYHVPNTFLDTLSPTTSHTLGIPPDGSSLSAIHLCVLGAQHGACHTADPVKWMNSFGMSCQYIQDTALTHKRAHFPEGKTQLESWSW